jgi:tetratricopeptide (TPR) repeat protein
MRLRLRNLLASAQAGYGRWLFAVCLACALAGGVHAQDEEEKAKDPLADRSGPLYKQSPYDRILLNQSNGGRELIVNPIDFPGRKRPEEPKKTDRLTVVMIDRPEDEFSVSWAAIEKITLFEEMVLAEANQAATAGKSEEAYNSFAYLLANHPELPQLEQSLQRYLFFDAGRLFKAGRNAEALTILEELYRRNPQYQQAPSPPLPQVMGAVVDRIMTSYVQDSDFVSARKTVSRLTQDYRRALGATTDKWQQQLVQLAMAQKNEAIAHVRADRYREANNSVKQMMRIWPELEGAAEFAAQVADRYPMLIVGVTQLPAEPDPLRLDSWPDRRAGRLRYRTLLECTGQGPEGGEYTCPFGSVRRSNDGKHLILEITPEKLNLTEAPVTGYDIANQLVAMATRGSASYSPAWSELATKIDVDDVLDVDISLREAHLMPEAYLVQKVGQGASDAEKAWVPYLIDANSPATAEDASAKPEWRYLLNPQYGAKTATQPREIIEQHFQFPELAVEALLAGDIDMIDRVPPRAIPRLRETEGVTLRRYAAPTLHMLHVNQDKAYLKNGTFRRALISALDRQSMLNLLVLENVPLEGFRVLSGPFPAGVRENDPLAYAYDEQIRPHTYSPPLAAVLSALAEREMKLIAEKRKVDPPLREKLILVHPTGHLPQLICDAIAKQLNAVGIECELKALPPGKTRPEDENWHLIYSQIMIREPIVDARRILGPGGLAGSENPYVNLALRDLDASVNWREAGRRLRALHRVVHDELTVLPLFQTVEYLAHRNSIANLPAEPVTFYQDIENWRIEPKTSD